LDKGIKDIMNKDLIILFDLDGTLIDSTDAILESFYFAFKDQNFDFTGNDQNIKDEIGYPLDVMFATLGVNKEDVWNFVDSYKLHYRKISKEKTTLLPNAKEAVINASKIARLGVVTTKTTRYSIPLLENFGLLEYFETIIGRQEVENPKPHPEPILNALKNMNEIGHTNTYMIGDTKLDLIAAQKANIKSVGVLCGYGKEVNLREYTSLIATNSLEAIKLINNR
jgi:phosphoglycolate phosphatase